MRGASSGELRSAYAGSLNALAQYFDVPPARWIADRSYLRHDREPSPA